MARKRRMLIERMSTDKLTSYARQEVYAAEFELRGYPALRVSQVGLRRALECLDELLERGEQGRFLS